MKRILHTVYLRLDTSSTSLTNCALAQLILKITFFLKDKSTLKNIKKNLTDVLRTKIDNEKINKAIKQLKDERKISIKSKKIILSESCKNLLIQAHKAYSQRFNETFMKYFDKAKTNNDILKPWFENVTIKFLEKYFYDWIGKLTKDPRMSAKTEFDLDQNFRFNFKKHKKILKSDYDWLTKQYYKFLNSDDPNDNALLWDFGTSLFSATLITANLSADQLSVGIFKDSNIVLDTNILLEINLEGSEYTTTFKDIEKVLKHLNTKLYYFHISDEEYKKKINGTRIELKKVINEFSIDVLGDIDDIFLKTAFLRGCENAEDIDRFIDQLMYIPEYLYKTLKITKLDYSELSYAIEKGQHNKNLKENINQCSRKIHYGKSKRKNPLKHDAGLITGIEFLREKNKYWILTIDNTLICYAIDFSTRDEYPMAFGVDTLINVLAINNGGVDIDPSNFAPLFSKIIKMGLIPHRKSFQIEDLSYILDAQIQINALPDEAIKNIANKLNKNRLIGLSDEKIALELRRDFETEKFKFRSDFDSIKKDLALNKSQKQEFKEKASAYKEIIRKKLISEKRDKYDKKIRCNRLIFFLFLPIICPLIIVFILYLNKSSMSEKWQSILIGFALNVIFWFIINILFVHPKIIKKYSERINNIEEEVNNEITDLL